MSKNFVLIDLENVQPKNISLLKSHPFEVFVFVGSNQSKLSFDLASAMQELGNSGKYIKIEGSGKNSLDFHISYYIGVLAKENPEAHFHIITKDKGFDPLISHLKKNKVKIQRESDLAEIPVLRISSSKSDKEQIDAIVKNLKGRGQSRPRKVKTLANTIKSLFTEKLADKQLQSIITELQNSGYITIDNNNISYHLKKK